MSEWIYTNPSSNLTLEAENETTSNLTRETWNEGMTRTDGETTQVWQGGQWVTVE